MAKGIRTYGDGTRLIDQYAYNAGFDAEADYGEDGRYSILWLDDGVRDEIREDAKKSNEPLTRTENNRLKNNVAVIFFESGDGLLEGQWFDDASFAEEDWEETVEFSDAD